MASEMNGKTVIITGGASGIGLATGKALASMGAHVVAVGRNPEKGKKAVAAIKASAGHERVEFILCDLSSLEQVRTLAGDVIARIPRLDVLVNNAGLLLPDRCESADGFDMVLAVNHLAPFLLTHLLLDKLKAGAPARIVNVSTGGHSMATINFDDLQSTKKYSIIGDKPDSTFSLMPGFRTRNAGARGRCHHQYHVTFRHLRGGATQCPGFGYGTAKAGLNIMTQNFARDLEPDNIAAILLCPGFTATERAVESGGAAVYGEPDPMDVPAKAATYLASCDNPMDYTGKIVDAATLVQELNLL